MAVASTGDAGGVGSAVAMDSMDTVGMEQCDLTLIDVLSSCVTDLSSLLDSGAATDESWAKGEVLLIKMRDELLAANKSSCGKEIKTQIANNGGINVCMRFAGQGSITAYECLQSMILNNVAVAGRCIKAGIMSLLDTTMSSGQEADVAVALFVLASLVHVNREHSYFIKSGMLPDVVRITGDLANGQKFHTFNGRSNSMAARACSILDNLSLNMKNHEEMIAKGAPGAISAFLADPTLTKAIRLKAVFALALMVGKKENDGHSMLELDRETLDSIMTACWNALECKTAFGYPFILWKVLQALSQFTLVDRNKELFLEMKIEELLAQVLIRIEANTLPEEIEHPKLSQRFALSTIWNIAFLEKGKQRLLAQPNLLETVRKAATEQGSPKLKQEARGALWTLGDRDFMQATFGKAAAPASTNEQKLGTIMISYANEDTPQVAELQVHLEAAGFRALRHADNSLELMAQAVEGSSIVLCCCSNAYQESQMCRTEAEYAYGQRKPILPVNVEKGFQPTGWLGALAGTHTAYQMHDLTKIKAVSVTLIDDLQKRIRPDVSTQKDDTAGARKGGAAKDVGAASVLDSWSKADVGQWLLGIGVTANVVRRWTNLGVDGRALKGLALLRNDRSLAVTLRNDMSVRNPVELLHIVSALDTLV